jgi:alpha-glucosidase
MDDYTVALPPAGWYDYWTGARVDGNANRKAIDNNPVTQPEVHIHRTLDTLPVFARAGAIVPEQPLVQSTEETPQGPLILRVYPPAAGSKDCGGSLYLDDGVTYAFMKGDFLRVGFSCQRTAQGLSVAIEPHRGSFASWWKLVSIEVYGATKPALGASFGALGSAVSAASPISTGFDAEHHRITALLPDDGKGLELRLIY